MPVRCAVGLRGYTRPRFQVTPPRPANPEVKSNAVAGSGTGEDCASVMEPLPRSAIRGSPLKIAKDIGG